MATPDTIDCLDDVKQFTSFGTDIDLTSAAQSKCARAARTLKVITAGGGAISLLMMVNDAATPRLLDGLTDGEALEPMKILKIFADGTTVTKIRIGW